MRPAVGRPTRFNVDGFRIHPITRRVAVRPSYSRRPESASITSGKPLIKPNAGQVFCQGPDMHVARIRVDSHSHVIARRLSDVMV